MIILAIAVAYFIVVSGGVAGGYRFRLLLLLRAIATQSLNWLMSVVAVISTYRAIISELISQ